jgi:hypothetical protein
MVQIENNLDLRIQTPGTLDTLPRFASGKYIGNEAVRALWYENGSVGQHSEKASKQGSYGLGSPRFATVANGGPVVMTVAPIYGRGASGPTRAMALDADRLLQVNGGLMPEDAATLKRLLTAHPDCIIADVKADRPPMTFRIDGVPAGKRMIVLAGAEALEGVRPAGTMVNLLNDEQIPAKLKDLIPRQGIPMGTRLPLAGSVPYEPAATKPAKPTSSPSSSSQSSASKKVSAEIDAILADPNISIEDKISMILLKIMELMDQKIDAKLKEIRDVQATPSEEGNAEGSSQKSMDTLNFELQRLATKRSQLFDTMSAIVNKYDQTAQRIIQNLGQS